MDRRVFLKVKLKSLAEEARIIKREENKRKVPRRSGPIPLQVADMIVRERAIINRIECRRLSAARRAKDWYPMSLQELQELHVHRIRVVRTESRLTSIAYGFIRGRDFRRVDSGAGLLDSDWKRIEAMVKKYGASGSHEMIYAWRDGSEHRAAA
jgi:hypothetical protein